MAKKFIMVSLEEDKAKDIADVLSNENCRKILDYLTEKSSSESDLVKSLKLPASTVNYNIKLLLKSKLIEVKDFLWSEKGNKVNVYQAAKKFIVISPRSSKITSQLKNIVPVVLISLVATGLLYFYNRFVKLGAISKELITESTLENKIMIDEIASMPVQPEPNFALWFLFGAGFSIIIYIIYVLVRSRE